MSKTSKIFTDKTIVGVPDAYWEGLPRLHEGHTSDMVLESGPYRVWVSRMDPEDYGFNAYPEGSPGYAAQNAKALRMWHDEKIVIEKDVPRKGWVRLPRHRMTLHTRSR